MAERPKAEESRNVGADERDGRGTGVLASWLHEGIWEDERGAGDSADANEERVDQSEIS
jgi:hypothetical protein